MGGLYDQHAGVQVAQHARQALAQHLRWQCGGQGVQARHLARRALMQQGGDGFQPGVGTAPAFDYTAQQHIGQGSNRHSLMVRHKSSHRSTCTKLGLTCGRIVQRFYKAVALPGTQCLQAMQVGTGGSGTYLRCQCSGVGRNNQFIRRGAAQRQTRYALGCVLVSQRCITPCIRAFRNTPRHMQGLGKRDLLSKGHRPCIVQHTAFGFFQHHTGHEVLKHRPRPRAQTRGRPERIEHAPQCSPVRHRHIAFGNGQQTGQPRLGGKQVIEAGVELLLRHAQANVKQVALGVVQKSKAGFPRQLLQALGHDAQALCRYAKVRRIFF